MGYDVARYLSIDEVGSPTFTADGDLLFLSDTTGTKQVWRLSDAGEWPERLTPYEERVSGVDASPTRREFAFAMDRDGDERDQLYRYDLDGGDIASLTDDPDVVHTWGGWSPDGDRVAYTANRRDRGTFDAYVQPRDGDAGDATLAFEGDGGWLRVAAWGPDGKRLALVEPQGGLDADLHLVNLASGERRRLSDDSEAYFGDVHFGREGNRLFLVTNHGAETAYLGTVDVDTGEIGTLASGGDWSVDGLALDRRTGRLVYTRNVDGYTTVHTGYLDRGDLVENVAPDVEGVVSAVELGPEGNRYALARSAPTDPHGIDVVEFGTDLVRKWTGVGNCGIQPETFRDQELVRYESFDGREIPAYWTLPEGADSGAVPVVVDVHGGPEHQRRPWFYPQKQFYLDRGYAVFEPNVRGSTGYGREYTHLDDVEKRMDSVKDIERGVAWLREHPAVDPDRIVAYGRSYGGFMVLAAITEYPELWSAAVEFVGIANFVTFLENTGEWRRSHREAEYGSLTEDREFLEDVSPIHRVDRIECPLFVQHGANDPRVPVGEARQIAEALEERGVPVETCVFEDEGHHTTTRENRIEEFERVAAFLHEHV